MYLLNFLFPFFILYFFFLTLTFLLIIFLVYFLRTDPFRFQVIGGDQTWL